jgi:hypothetical protein
VNGRAADYDDTTNGYAGSRNDENQGLI